jgi:PKD repeat protein
VRILRLITEEIIMADAKGGALSGWFKTAMGGTVGLVGGVAAMYATAVVDKVVKPAKPMANFSWKADGLTVTCENRAVGESGWWDFGDGSALEPFAPNQTATHVYAKPGNYNVKLTVRNFLSEENDRTVPVEVGTASASTATASTSATAPAAQLTVVPVTPNPVAPATFKVTGQVSNAEKAFLDVVSPGVTQAGGVGSPNRITVTPAGGVIETLIVVDKPGEHAIQLFGTKGNDVIKQVAFVKVAAPAEGSLAAYLRVSDTGIKVDTRVRTEQVAIAVPTKGTAKSFERVLTGLPGYEIQDVKIKSPLTKLAANLKTTIMPDKRTCKLAGDWAGTPEALAKLAGGTDLFVTLDMTCTKQEVVVVPTTVSVRLTGNTGTTSLPPMPRGLTNPQRQIDLEMCVYRTTGERSLMATGRLVPGQPLRKPIDWAGQKFLMDASVTDRQATVTFNRAQ